MEPGCEAIREYIEVFQAIGGFGFWGQLICTVVAVVILSFFVVVTGRISSPATFYATAGGIATGFISVFWSFGYIRLSDKLRKTVNDPSKKRLLELSSFDDLELDMWRFRLPESTRPELASAVLTDGELIVMVPKGGEVGDGNDNNGEFRGSMGNNNNINNARLVFVQ